MPPPRRLDDPAVDDPIPQPPPALDPDACCGQGCTPCMLELQAEKLDCYRADLAAWQARHGVPVPAAPLSHAR